MIGRAMRRLWYRLNRTRFENELRGEMETHREEMRGVTGDVRRFGNVLQLQEESRAVWGWTPIDTLGGDIRLAFRSMRRDARFTITTLLTLAAGFALVTVTASVVRAYLASALPYPYAERLYHVMYAPPGPWEPANVSRLDWSALRGVVEQAITARGERAFVPRSDGRAPQPIRMLAVGNGFAGGVALRAEIGRAFDSTMLAAREEPVAMIGYALWERTFSGDSAVIGRTIAVTRDGDEGSEAGATSYRIIGVLPQRFYFGRDSRDSVDVMVPLERASQTYVVRLRGGVAPSAAEERLTLATRAVSSDIPSGWDGVHLESMHERYVRPMRPVLRMAAVAVSAMMLLVAINLAILALLRALRRHHESCVKLALGASRLRVARGPTIEAGVLCIAAGVMGVAVASLVLDAAGTAIGTQLGRPSPRGVQGIAIDGGAIAILGIMALAMTVLLAIIPVVASTGADIANALRSGRATSAGRSATGGRSILMVAEIAGSVALLVASGLTIRSAINLSTAPRGFDVASVMRGRLAFPGDVFATPEALAGFYDTFRNRVQEATGERPAFASWPLFSETAIELVEADNRRSAPTGRTAITDGFIGTTNIALVRGRDFTGSDGLARERVAIVSQSLGRALWGSADPLGERLRLVDTLARDTTPKPWLNVVGVVNDIRRVFGDAQTSELYTSYLQDPPNRFASFYVRAPGNPNDMSRALRSAAVEIDPRIETTGIRLLADEDAEASEARFIVTLLSSLAAFGVALAAIGLAGVTAYAVQQRERESAIRMALGATPSRIVRAFVQRGFATIASGVAMGIVVAIAGTRVLASRIHGLSTTDAFTYTVAGISIALVATFAVWIPARRAASDVTLHKLRENS